MRRWTSRPSAHEEARKSTILSQQSPATGLAVTPMRRVRSRAAAAPRNLASRHPAVGAFREFCTHRDEARSIGTVRTPVVALIRVRPCPPWDRCCLPPSGAVLAVASAPTHGSHDRTTRNSSPLRLSQNAGRARPRTQDVGVLGQLAPTCGFSRRVAGNIATACALPLRPPRWACCRPRPSKHRANRVSATLPTARARGRSRRGRSPARQPGSTSSVDQRGPVVREWC
jgi:hypothetical protein